MSAEWCSGLHQKARDIIAPLPTQLVINCWQTATANMQCGPNSIGALALQSNGVQAGVGLTQ